MWHLEGLVVLVVSLGLLAPLYGQAAGPSEEERKLMKEKLATARQELDESLQMLRDVRADVLSVLPAYQHCVDAGLELHQESKDRVKLMEDLVKFAKAVEEQMQARLKSGAGRQRDLYSVRYMRIDAELRLLREKKKAK